MGKVTRRSSTDREETTKQPRRKRRKRDLDRIHSKILQAKRKLVGHILDPEEVLKTARLKDEGTRIATRHFLRADNVERDGNKAGQKRQSKARICNRLLPEPAAGIYRNGAKGKDIQKAETSENTFRKARLKADALKLFNGDTHGSKCIVEISSCDKTIKQSSNKDCMKQSLGWTLEQSPVLGKRLNQNQKPCLIKKKGEENIFEDTDSNKLKQNVNNDSRHSQKEDICKRRLFQNDREQLETITATSTTLQPQIFDNTDFTKENEENETEQMCLKNSKASACSPLSCYMEFCKIISAENFDKDILPNYDSDPLTTTIKRLRHAYTNSFRQQLLRKKKQELENVELAYSVEHQACTSDISQFSPVEFEVPKCSENHTIAHLQKGLSSQKNDKFHLMQNAELKKSDGKTRYSSTSCSSQNFTTYNTNSPVMENCENNDTQRLKQSKDIRQLPKATSFYFMNDKDSIQLDSQKNSNYVSHLLKNRRHDEDFSIDILDHGNSRCIDLGTSMFLSDSILSKRHFTKDNSREKLPITVSDNCASNNVSQKCNNRTTNKCNEKNVKRIPTILRRYNIINNKPNCPVQTAGDHAELYETTFPNVLKNLSTSSTNAIFDQTKILGPQIGSMKIKDSQESQEQFDINMHLKERNGRNEFYRYDDSLPRTFETSYNINAYSEKLPQQEQQISPNIRSYLFHSNNHRPINYLRSVNFPNSNVEPKKVFPQQTELHMRETSKQSLYRKDTRNQNQNILFNNVNDRAIPSPILNFPQNIQTEKRSAKLYQEVFDKTDVHCAKNQINRNACHCNEQYIYLHSAHCPSKYKRQTHYFRETAQPESLCDTRGYNNSRDNCINVSDTMQNIPLLSLKQKNNLYAYPKAIDDQHRSVLLRDVTQPVKYLAVKSGSDIQRIPVYINDRSVKVAENVPLKVIALMEPSAQTKVFSQEIATHVVPLQTDSSHFNNFATRKISDQSFVKHLDSMNAIVLNPNSQSNIWYASNL